MDKIPFYIGCYTAGKSRGIHRSELDLKDGSMSPPVLVAELENPTFLAVHPQQPVLYSVSEVRRNGKREQAQVMAYQIEPDGRLTMLGGQPAGGDGPCFVSVDRAGTMVLVANYGSGSVSAFSLNRVGRLGTRVSNIQHVGRSIDPERQTGPHAHCILPDSSDRFACAVDLGLDQVIIYALDRSGGGLRATGQVFHAAPGLGPRHIAFHPNGQHAFVIHEMGSQLSACRWDDQVGRLEEVGRVTTLPTDFTGSNTTAEVLVHPQGTYVYGSNRGHDSIAIYRFDVGTGTLVLLDHVSTQGRTPRNFRIDPTGRYLLAQNQDSDSIVAFQVDASNGSLTAVGQPIEVGSPCCIKFAA